MRIILDSNVLFDDPVMVREPATRVISLLEPADAVLVFSPVVLAELQRQHRDKLREHHATAESRIKRLARLAGSVDADADALAEVRSLASAAHARWERRWEEILAHPRVEVADWPSIDAQQMVDRELERRRPFLDKELGTIGHRDRLIWLGVLEQATAHRADEILFVTADKGFLGVEKLHGDLIEDLKKAGVDDSVFQFGSLPALATRLREEAELHGKYWREDSINETLYHAIMNLEASDFTEHYDAREGDFAAPTFYLGLPTTGHNWTLTHIDGPGDVQISDVGFGKTEVECAFVVELMLSGVMDKSAWFSEEHPEVDLWDADVNNWLVEIEAYQRVRFRASVTIDDINKQAKFDRFIDATPESEQSGVTVC